MIDALLAAQRGLAERPVDEILTVLERVARRWLDPGDELRVEALAGLAESTGLAPAMLRRGLDQMIQRMQGLGALLDQDLGTREALDGFAWRAPGVLSRAFGPGLLTCVFSGNVPGIPAFDMALGLALKSAVLVRPASEEPVFAPLFARSVAEVDADLGRCLAVARWGYEETWAYERAGAVLAYGGDESVAAIRRLVPPEVRFVGHGHKISFAVIAREAATAETARRLALDVAMYDQQGCVSPHMAFVERGGALAPAAFAAAVGEALARLQGEMPRGRLTAAEAMALRSVRDEAEFTADAYFGSQGDLSWAVVHGEEARFLPSPLNRLLRTFAVDDVRDVAGVVAPFGSYLQTVAWAGPDERRTAVAELLGRLGASRVTPVGRVQEPSPLWRHDGRPTAGDLVRWVDMEG
ncbi:MAG TPA: acyl-CoA reductase [Symbiobacteriaceae bacterium]|jgi:acyl-CoA reductase-like NAD-dependent aldehyde dehydrogenase|nr:acyl-CoA reductase [Symbiobacteriaceae bacterium]